MIHNIYQLIDNLTILHNQQQSPETINSCFNIMTINMRLEMSMVFKEAKALTTKILFWTVFNFMGFKLLKGHKSSFATFTFLSQIVQTVFWFKVSIKVIFVVEFQVAQFTIHMVIVTNLMEIWHVLRQIPLKLKSKFNEYHLQTQFISIENF